MRAPNRFIRREKEGSEKTTGRYGPRQARPTLEEEDGSLFAVLLIVCCLTQHVWKQTTETSKGLHATIF